ncbi:MAG: CoA transferase [Alphaproteobacteria bacterium]|nr:CoA transferase [Alphaproteobacteria bacterium]
MLPLQGVCIIAVEQYGAGPFGTLQLADMGAEIIKIENKREGGELGRHVRHGQDFLPQGDSLFYQSFNRNKRSITLDLKHAEGQTVLHDLARGADGVLNNLRGDQPAKLGLTYADLKAANPRIVAVHLSAYGREGKRAGWPGFDYLMQAEAGYLALTGEPEGPPTRMGLSLVDFSTGVQAALAMVSGILAARATGEGRDLDVSLFDTALANLSYVATWYLSAGINQGREPRSSHPNITPSQLYRTAGGWIFIMCNKDKFWPELTACLGRPEWATDPRFESFAKRLEHRALLTRLLDEALMEKTTAEWLDIFAGRVPAAPVNDIASALDSAFVKGTDRVMEIDHPAGRLRMVAPAIRSAGEAPPRRPAPELGGDTDAVLQALGYDASRIARLRQAGVI